MLRILVTAFEPYDDWEVNASWLALIELTRDLPNGLQVVTRRYPVDFAEVQKRLGQDLEGRFDAALHLGQAPGLASIHLEGIALNIGHRREAAADAGFVLCQDGPLAYRSGLPLIRWAKQLAQAGIPARVSYHAGTYLCNAVLYWSHHLAARRKLPTRSTTLHLPLDPSQVLGRPQNLASLPAGQSARAVRLLLEDLPSSIQIASHDPGI